MWSCANEQLHLGSWLIASLVRRTMAPSDLPQFALWSLSNFAAEFVVVLTCREDPLFLQEKNQFHAVPVLFSVWVFLRELCHPGAAAFAPACN
ncbi:hypothetical protein CSUI_003009 [Cystoisospora suis]|uniref:Uncharacterized protein n=1 Tax=Cystoisospora suis TaxID=483139 RepID=A0A2C6KRW7_9APIC|nr:hypothetical protein CSUI_003009 [Cystoisospora suis]